MMLSGDIIGYVEPGEFTHEDVAKRANDTLKELGVKPAWLVAVSGVDKATVSRFLRGLRPQISFQAVVQIAAALEVNLDWFAWGIGDKWVPNRKPVKAPGSRTTNARVVWIRVDRECDKYNLESGHQSVSPRQRQLVAEMADDEMQPEAIRALIVQVMNDNPNPKLQRKKIKGIDGGKGGAESHSGSPAHAKDAHASDHPPAKKRTHG